ncbi:hypothetical protein [Flavobacterium columnare]|uniref:Lipoprotein n=1 Tax=Flavobacterium columnare TaxID=996 RepID=A0AAI8GC92_9FLAO|nr:hypothetical protein [Flavobacterium columnare]AMO21457.2 hypothetical protein UN65_07755 [Flavobacterium columnare]AUX18201.1 hypothetical protein AQ623_07895 [Flavobacterium columnare]QOG57274.1 hypothetical protein HUE29_07820 [Flavobacterium columnare]QOG59998.1 hypothetical protein HUE30_07820 [Flavobacterium columnare]QOG62718.1 hypothetical protein HUE31_07820 [Flavobacterium columnare]
MKKNALTLFSILVLLVSCKSKNTALTTSETIAITDEKNKELNITSESTESVIKKNQQEEMLVEYTANTRGYSLRVKLTQKSLSYTENRDADDFKEVKLTAKQIDELQTLFDQINLKELEKIKAPTELRYHDGAPHADLKITKKGEEYQSTGFDHGHPPVEIEKFVSKLVSYINKE